VILPDANLLLYAYDSASQFHSRAAAWWSDCLSGAEPIGLCPAVIFAFLRIGTSSRVFLDPLTVEEATSCVESWLIQPPAQLVDVDLMDIGTAFELLRTAGTGGNLTTDAQLAAISLRHGGIVHTADSDFARFPKVRWHNPILQ
jgi:toxin-antitoxin system PIN domain toxin